MRPYLAVSAIVDADHPRVRELAAKLGEVGDPLAIAWRCFEWVRDRIRHSSDFRLNPVTCRASEVLKHRTGFCYAKSHLLAALLRANRIPAGFCYQRLSIDGKGPPFCLHAFNAIQLPGVGWYRVDARGNKPGVRAEFEPPIERLAFAANLPGEATFRPVLSAPLPVVVEALGRWRTFDELLAHLPDAAESEVHPQG